jgi:DNA-binding NarL/FixJ family response regulator
MHYDTGSSPNNSAGLKTASLRVFLIEDSVLLQELLAGMLSELDCVELCGCADGEAEALRRLAEAPVDLAIIDIELKQGSGIGVLDALQTDSDRYGHPRKVVLTNYAHATMRRQCEQYGTDAFFDKSMHLNQLIDYVVDAAHKNSRS